jgi:hypothetical protein
VIRADITPSISGQRALKPTSEPMEVLLIFLKSEPIDILTLREKFRDSDEQVDRQEEQIAHKSNLITSANLRKTAQ